MRNSAVDGFLIPQDTVKFEDVLEEHFKIFFENLFYCKNLVPLFHFYLISPPKFNHSAIWVTESLESFPKFTKAYNLYENNCVCNSEIRFFFNSNDLKKKEEEIYHFCSVFNKYTSVIQITCYSN